MFYPDSNYNPYAYNTPPPQPPKKDAPTWLKVIVGFAFLFVLLVGCVAIVGGGAEDKEETSTSSTLPPAENNNSQLAPGVAPGQATVPDVAGRNASIVGDFLEDQGFTNVTFSEANGAWVLLRQNYTTTGIEPGVGTVVGLDDPIVVYVRANY